jgi:hypothetical protein
MLTAKVGNGRVRPPSGRAVAVREVVATLVLVQEHNIDVGVKAEVEDGRVLAPACSRSSEEVKPSLRKRTRRAYTLPVGSTAIVAEV